MHEQRCCFASQRVVHDRLNSLTGYFIYTEPFNIFAGFTRNWRSRLSFNLIQHSDRAQLWKETPLTAKATRTAEPISKTTLHVHHAFLHISLPSLRDYDVKLPYFTISRLNERTQIQRFYFRFLNFNTALRLTLSEPACQPVQLYREFPY